MHGHEDEEDTDHNQRCSGGDVPTHACFGGAELPRGQCLILTPQPLMGQTRIPRPP